MACFCVAERGLSATLSGAELRSQNLNTCRKQCRLDFMGRNLPPAVVSLLNEQSEERKIAAGDHSFQAACLALETLQALYQLVFICILPICIGLRVILNCSLPHQELTQLWQSAHPNASNRSRTLDMGFFVRKQHSTVLPHTVNRLDTDSIELVPGDVQR